MPERDAERHTGMSADELAAFHRWKNEEAPRVMLRGLSEEVICQVWDIEYNADGRHWIELRRRRKAMNRLLDEQDDADERKSTFRKAILEKIVTLLVGACAALGLSWITKRTGVSIPGGAP